MFCPVWIWPGSFLGTDMTDMIFQGEKKGISVGVGLGKSFGTSAESLQFLEKKLQETVYSKEGTKQSLRKWPPFRSWFYFAFLLHKILLLTYEFVR